MMENITENNKLIAEFMGAKQMPDPDCWWFEIPPTKHGSHGWTTFFYHESWNWLMPVVEKIESMDYGFKICRKVVEVYIDLTKKVLFKVKESSRIESTYSAVVWFIKWYNQTK